MSYIIIAIVVGLILGAVITRVIDWIESKYIESYMYLLTEEISELNL